MERHITTVMIGVVAALLGWVGVTVSGTATSVAVLQQHVSLMAATVAKLETRVETATADRYTGTEAGRNNGILHTRIGEIERRTDGLESRMGIYHSRVAD